MIGKMTKFTPCLIKHEASKTPRVVISALHLPFYVLPPYLWRETKKHEAGWSTVDNSEVRP